MASFLIDMYLLKEYCIRGLIISCILFTGCNYFNTDVSRCQVTISYYSNKRQSELKNISAILGSDKFWWPSIAANKKEKVTLFPSRTPGNTLVLLYHLNNQSFSWESPVLTNTSPHEIDVVIHSNGDVKSRLH